MFLKGKKKEKRKAKEPKFNAHVSIRPTAQSAYSR